MHTAAQMLLHWALVVLHSGLPRFMESRPWARHGLAQGTFVCQNQQNATLQCRYWARLPPYHSRGEENAENGEEQWQLGGKVGWNWGVIGKKVGGNMGFAGGVANLDHCLGMEIRACFVLLQPHSWDALLKWWTIPVSAATTTP